MCEVPAEEAETAQQQHAEQRAGDAYALIYVGSTDGSSMNAAAREIRGASALGSGARLCQPRRGLPGTGVSALREGNSLEGCFRGDF